ncbi:MAG: bifunctional methylenetetrahydrofolate dehydrogenase/methenyltetrahydrofolate cyclohydrolase FolD [Burkholderiales bacterium]|jgi:methylenetetrahydrofolate dehydrogenase (NADP+)/methenyltetrahydrofolate cyclohydrolase|nr:bifunctional methylenetetrahydrofolate dehydrogenase/methenyltetrahydrofolate cyclohydrolase FolD [Nitrosomonadaceae bacterium]
MSATLIDGKRIAEHFRERYKLQTAKLAAAGVVPGLAVVIVGDDPASQVYVRNKARACESIGIRSQVHALPSSISQAELIAFVQKLNADAEVHGILVQLPLPGHLDDRAVIESIALDKDVDGFHYANMGRLVIDESPFPPCTPYGVMQMLRHEGISVDGKHAVIIGRSNIVGKPQAMLMLKEGATVTICHSRTQGLAEHCRRADILVAAVGRANFVRGDWVKPGAVVIDVGINRLGDGTLCGDVHFAEASQVASAITPVPGGVGPMTIAMLLGNTLRAAARVRGLSIDEAGVA